MASKNVHIGSPSKETLEDLGFTDINDVGFCTNSEVVDVYLSESQTQWTTIQDLLTTETTSDLTTVKRAFILPMHNVSTDRLKASLKEHKISVTNDYEKADFIIPHTNFYDSYTNIPNIPQTKLMFKVSNGYYCHDHRPLTQDYHDKTDNDVLLESRSQDTNYQHNMNYESAPFDSFIFSSMSLELASLIQNEEMQVIGTDTILNQSANRIPITQQLIDDITKMADSYSATDDDVEMAGKIIPTIDPTGEPYLLYESATMLDNVSYKFNRNKDVMYWMDKHNIYNLSRKNAEEAIKYFDEKGQLDSRCFKSLEVKCREQIQINNRELYTFKVQVKPEYRKYMKD
jgi:hypothetical protein|tara:strand:- start:3104 stop:4135 length:1032 start_codon:yes stop_codon:yes gene_type:complete